MNPERQREAEPRGIPGAPEKPVTLSGLASACWDYTVEQLGRIGVLSKTDGHALELYCCEWAAYHKATADGDRRAACAAWKNCDKALARFGLYPAERPHLKVLPGASTLDPFEALLSGSAARCETTASEMTT